MVLDSVVLAGLCICTSTSRKSLLSKVMEYAEPTPVPGELSPLINGWPTSKVFFLLNGWSAYAPSVETRALNGLVIEYNVDPWYKSHVIGKTAFSTAFAIEQGSLSVR
ncbi:hypothetical protein PGT21_003018 [Puccinia graminis f. sp. tritici]|uniref:Uncharacterized protein n=1 Tax=Puccinia graminis f. sp. tritici TaxID=56615 RepID=A0A5B0SG07_PUCGR|nr:hypothetical protein PGT21_003018 [Puccinia graminis f. sp. tritici]KAA1136938.1 hypothetical protein PGTUg99_009223 [Puccinia graminis f. sp. tritici]